MKINIRLVIISVILAGAVISLQYLPLTPGEDATTRQFRKAFRENYRIFAPEIPDQIDFAGEPAPLHLVTVREKLDRELLINTYWHTSTLTMMKRANRYFPMIESILREHNIPDDFKYLALVESRLENVISPRGATGFWQFLKETAREYGLEVNLEVDERYDPEKSTVAACEYLKKAFSEYQNWTLVAASYNAGNRRIGEAVEEQNTTDYYELWLNEETSRYIYRILAVKTIFQNPTRYGFYLTPSDLYPEIPSEEIVVEKDIPDLMAFADSLGISYSLLKEFNPWLRNTRLSVDKNKIYVIHVPDSAGLIYENLMQGTDRKSIMGDSVELQDLY